MFISIVFIDFLKVLWFGDFRVSLVGSFSVLRFFGALRIFHFFCSKCITVISCFRMNSVISCFGMNFRISHFHKSGYHIVVLSPKKLL